MAVIERARSNSFQRHYLAAAVWQLFHTSVLVSQWLRAIINHKLRSQLVGTSVHPPRSWTRPQTQVLPPTLNSNWIKTIQGVSLLSHSSPESRNQHPPRHWFHRLRRKSKQIRSIILRRVKREIRLQRLWYEKSQWLRQMRSNSRCLAASQPWLSLTTRPQQLIWWRATIAT